MRLVTTNIMLRCIKAQDNVAILPIWDDNATIIEAHTMPPVSL